MSVFGGIVLFTLGVAAGGGAVIFNQKCVRDQTSQLRRENEHLRESAWLDRVEFVKHKAYQRGYRDGRQSPANEVEKFAEFVEDHNIDFRAPRRRRSSGDGQQE